MAGTPGDFAALLTGLAAVVSSVATLLAVLRVRGKVEHLDQTATQARDEVRQVHRELQPGWRWQNGYTPLGGAGRADPTPPAGVRKSSGRRRES